MCIFVIYIEFFPYCLFVSNSQVIGCEDRLRNDLYCVGWGVELYSIQSNKRVIMEVVQYAGFVEAENDSSPLTVFVYMVLKTLV